MKQVVLLLLGVAALAGCEGTVDVPEALESERQVGEQAAIEVSQAEEIELGERIALDGRPEWWYPEPRFDERGLSVCVETISLSLREAREAAIELGRDRAAMWIKSRGKAPLEETYDVERVWAWPLPERPGREERYAGYARVRMGME